MTSKQRAELERKIERNEKWLAQKLPEFRNECFALLLKIRTVSYQYGTVCDREFLLDPRLPGLERQLETLSEVDLEAEPTKEQACQES